MFGLGNTTSIGAPPGNSRNNNNDISGCNQSTNKLAAMTCILRGFQHLNSSEFAQNMKKEVAQSRNTSSPKFNNQYTSDLNHNML